MNEHIDMKISGSSTMPGGEYGSVSISGAGKVNGSLKCEELHCSGAAKVQGDVDCAGELHTSGAGKIAGSVRCGSLSASGDFSAQLVQVGGLRPSPVPCRRSGRLRQTSSARPVLWKRAASTAGRSAPPARAGSAGILRQRQPF